MRIVSEIDEMLERFCKSLHNDFRIAEDGWVVFHFESAKYQTSTLRDVYDKLKNTGFYVECRMLAGAFHSGTATNHEILWVKF